MPTKPASATALSALLLALFAGCSGEHHHEHDGHEHAAMAGHESAWSGVKQLVAVMHATEGSQCTGIIRFTEVDEQVYVYGEFSGLTPNQQHAMHIHEFGDCSKTDASSAGAHYNPEGHEHGLSDKPMRHAGDLGNIQADAEGKAVYRDSFTNISMVGLKNPIIGRSVIVHAKPDDGRQPTGNAGARIACGVIGIANPVQ